jgi:transposase-like protein
MNMRKQFPSDFKFKVAIEALKNEKTATELASQFEISVSQVSKWKSDLLQNGQQVFSKKRGPKKLDPTDDPDHLLHEIGKLKIERDFLAKKYKQIQLRGDD